MSYPEIGIEEPWWTHIRQGTKKVEGRDRSILCTLLGLDKSTDPKIINEQLAINKKVWIKLNGTGVAALAVLVKIVAVRCYANRDEYLETESLESTLPGVTSLDEARTLCSQYFSNPEVEDCVGVVALEIKVLS